VAEGGAERQPRVKAGFVTGGRLRLAPAGYGKKTHEETRHNTSQTHHQHASVNRPGLRHRRENSPTENRVAERAGTYRSRGEGKSIPSTWYSGTVTMNDADSPTNPLEPALEPLAFSEPAVEMVTEAAPAVQAPPVIEPPIIDPPADARPQSTAWKRLWHEVTSGVQTLVSAAVYATLIVTFVVQVARVDGLSMAPTLEDHDRLIVNKLVYELSEPRPGDIVMLYYPLNPEKMFVKRVIAKEGDTVRIVDGRVYVNDIPLHDDYVPAEFRSHDDWGPQVVQQGYYFVMGDHRNNSSDSRHWGPVPKKYIVGKVKVRWWPIQDARIF
jgi:signal peptidase I